MKGKQLMLTSNNGIILAVLCNESYMSVEPCVGVSYRVTAYSPFMC